MRTFYLFKIKKSYSELTHDTPYNLFKAIENVYYLKQEDLSYFNNFFVQIRDTFNKEYLDNNIFEFYKNKYSYTKVNNVHMINDYYTAEKSKLIISKSYLYIKSTKNLPTFLKAITRKDNIFVCDFVNKDYFWLEELA